MLGPPYQALVDPTTGIPRMNFNGQPLSDLHSIIIIAQLVSKPKIIDKTSQAKPLPYETHFFVSVSH